MQRSRAGAHLPLAARQVAKAGNREGVRRRKAELHGERVRAGAQGALGRLVLRPVHASLPEAADGKDVIVQSPPGDWQATECAAAHNSR